MQLLFFDNDDTITQYSSTGTSDSFADTLLRDIKEKFSLGNCDPGKYIEQLQAKHATRSAFSAITREHGFDFEEFVGQTVEQLKMGTLGILHLAFSERMAISMIQGTKVVFTNNPGLYAKQTLRHLGMAEYFDGIFGAENFEATLKPHPNAYQAAAAAYPGHDEIILCDDDLPNLETARGLGWRTVHFNPRNGSKNGGTFVPDFSVSSFAELAQLPILKVS